MLLFQIVCLIISTVFFRCISIFDIFLLGINYIGLTVFSFYTKLYKATVSLEKEQVAYIGLTSTTFKERYNNHSKSFNHEKYQNETELSKYVWKLKKKNSKFSITWKIISQATTKRRPSNQCNLCLEEKYQILKYSEKNRCLLLNKRFEIRACNHK